MKKLNLVGTLILSLTLSAGMMGCKSKTPITPIPDVPMGGPATPQTSSTPTPSPGGPGTGIGAGSPTPVESTPTPINGNLAIDPGKYGQLFDGPHTEDAEKFKADTVYFDFDSATVKSSEESKLQEVASYFKDNPRMEGLIIQGNCDERGTEKYNLSLGERRALAVREYLANLGVKPERIKTVTFGASKPVDTGHDEAAWKKNRRGDFVLVLPK